MLLRPTGVPCCDRELQSRPSSMDARRALNFSPELFVIGYYRSKLKEKYPQRFAPVGVGRDFDPDRSDVSSRICISY